MYFGCIVSVKIFYPDPAFLGASGGKSLDAVRVRRKTAFRLFFGQYSLLACGLFSCTDTVV